MDYAENVKKEATSSVEVENGTSSQRVEKDCGTKSQNVEKNSRTDSQNVCLDGCEKEKEQEIIDSDLQKMGDKNIHCDSTPDGTRAGEKEDALENVDAKTTKESTVQESLKGRSGWDAVAEVDQFGAYMGEKQRKLREQYTAEASALGMIGSSNKDNECKPNVEKIFNGVTVWVDGRTAPSRLEIRRLVMRGGGEMETYLTRRVTHIVADGLAAATRRRLLTRRDSTAGKLHLVTASWIAQCVQQGTRLSERRFPIPGVADRSQKSIATMFPAKPRAQMKSNPRKKPHSK